MNRTIHQTVAFASPVRLPGVDAPIPAGTYDVETEEELLEHLSFPAYHRLSTRIRIPVSSASYQVFQVDPADLESAGGKLSPRS